MAFVKLQFEAMAFDRLGLQQVRLEACKLLVSAGFRLDAGMRLGYRPQAWLLFEASAGFRLSVLVHFWFETGCGFSLVQV